MPATVKVKVFAARNLPVMDRTSFLTDAFVEVRLGNSMFKTEVIRRTLNPEWNSDWFCFELSEESLQEESLQVRVLDHDTYSAHDAIGRVYFDLTPLLQTEKKRNLSGWFPLYDTMHGIRGEIRLAVRVDLFSDVCRHRFSSLGVRFFFSSNIPSGYRVVSLIGFVRELIMNDDPEHQWIEKIRTSRASNEARQCLFSQLAGELQSKLSRKVLNLGGNAVIGYRLHFDLEGDTGIVARASGTAVRLQRISSSNLLQVPKKLSYGREVETGSGVAPLVENESKTLVEAPGREYALTSPKPLSDAEFPFLTISHPPRDLIRHFGSAIAAKSVKLLETTNSRAAWWLELRTEALTRMYNVGCDALIGYREECTIYEDVCVLSIYATAVTLNQLWVHTLPSESSPSPSAVSRKSSRQESCGSAETDPHVARESGPESSPNNCLLIPPNSSSTSKNDSTSSVDCSICHIASINQALPPNKSMRCRLCEGAYVPEFLLSSTDFPPELPVVGRPAFIQVGLSRSKKEEKGESAAREISELLPYIEYELHYRLLQKLKLRGMNAIFGLSLQLAIGEELVSVLATGTAVYIPALPSPQLQKASLAGSSSRNSLVDMQQNLLSFNQECQVLYGLPNVTNNFSRDTLEMGFPQPSSGDLVDKENKRATVDAPQINSSVHLNFHEEFAGTYVVDAREPEPEELNSLLTEPLPPPGLLFMTTDNLPNEESYSYLVKLKREQSVPTPHGIHIFVKLHAVQSLKPDDALGSTFLHYPTSWTPTADIPSLSLPLSTSLDSSVNTASLMNRCMAKCMRDCCQLTWFHFRDVMPCAITSLAYRLTITDDDVVQILCSGVVVTPTVEEASPQLRYNASTGSTKSEAVLKMSMSAAKKSIFNLPKGFRSGTAIELKPMTQHNCGFEKDFAEHVMVKNPPKKTKWWKLLSKNVTAKRSKRSSTAEYSEGSTNGIHCQNGSSASEEGKCVLTPSTGLPNCKVEHYLGSYSFFFVRETNDLREMGGLRCFVHAAITEAQSVAAAHTVGLGGNALLSYQISEMLVLRPASRNQAQCLINLCGDMVRTSAN